VASRALGSPGQALLGVRGPERLAGRVRQPRAPKTRDRHGEEPARYVRRLADVRLRRGERFQTQAAISIARTIGR
jgi:hypothetical protein